MSETNNRHWRPVFIGGCPRSGTTLLADLLAKHSNIEAIPEAQFKFDPALQNNHNLSTPDVSFGHVSLDIWGLEVPVEKGSLAQVFCRTVEAFLLNDTVQNCRWIVDHTPENLKHAALLAEEFPGARFIHLVRDGRGVAASLIPLDWGASDIISAATTWTAGVGFGLAAESYLDGVKIRRVRFEDLVRKPEAVLQKLCEWLDVRFEPAMIEGGGYAIPSFNKTNHALVGSTPDPSRATSWTSKLSKREIELFEMRTGDLLVHMGYEKISSGEASPTFAELAGLKAKSYVRQHVWDRIRFARRFRNIVNRKTADDRADLE
ncbi:MAG: sulfotransferase [Rubricoccaceae bacterium]|nr:sulfotransferase [Rubricoccaceae bacterium]